MRTTGSVYRVLPVSASPIWTENGSSTIMQAVADKSDRADDVPMTEPTFRRFDGDSATTLATPVVNPRGMIWNRRAEKLRTWARTPVSDGPSVIARSLAVMMARTRLEIDEMLSSPAELTN